MCVCPALCVLEPSSDQTALLDENPLWMAGVYCLFHPRPLLRCLSFASRSLPAQAVASARPSPCSAFDGHRSIATGEE